MWIKWIPLRRIQIEDERDMQICKSLKQGSIESAPPLPVFGGITAGQPRVVLLYHSADNVELWLQCVNHPFEVVLQGQMIIEWTIQYPDGSSQRPSPGKSAWAFSFNPGVCRQKAKIPAYFVRL
jgi:SOS-response transcriptional repressor LexA